MLVAANETERASTTLGGLQQAPNTLHSGGSGRAHKRKGAAASQRHRAVTVIGEAITAAQYCRSERRIRSVRSEGPRSCSRTFSQVCESAAPSPPWGCAATTLDPATYKYESEPSAKVTART